MVQSSPSPTPIIASINQSSYVCSQSSSPRTTPLAVPYNDSEIFQRPMKFAPQHRGERNSKCKEIVIVQKVHKSSVALANIANTQKTFVANAKVDASCRQTCMLPPHCRQQNYQFQNLAINNFVHTHTSQNVYQGVMPNSQLSPSVQYLQTMKINNYNIEQTNFYVPVYPQNVPPRHAAHSAVPFLPSPVCCKKERKSDDKKHKTINRNGDRSHIGEKDQNQS